MTLGELCDVSQGATLSRLKDEHGELYKIIQIADLDGLNAYSPLDFQKLSKDKTPTVQVGDVLLSLRGLPIRATVVPVGMWDCVPSPNLAVIRPRPPTQRDPIDGVEPNYLAGLLGSAFMIRDLYARSGGGTIFSISIRKLKELKVPVPPGHVQDYFGKAFSARHQLVVAMNELAELQSERLDAELAIQLGREDE